MTHLKINSRLKRAAMLLAFMLLTSISAWAQGTFDNPYQISNYAQLKQFAAIVNNGTTGAYAVLTADIACDDNMWTPIGNSSNKYTGTFDGRGYTITGLSNADVDPAPSYAGLFGSVGSSGVVQKVVLKNVTISGNDYVGGIAGWNSGLVYECHVLAGGTITGKGTLSVSVGGVVGLNNGGATVSYCTSAASISASSANSNSDRNFGGIAGCNGGSLTNNLAVGANITGGTNQSNRGAIAGKNEGSGTSSTLSNNYYSGCRVGSASSNIGCNGTDVTDNDGAVPLSGGYIVTVSNNITANILKKISGDISPYYKYAEGETVNLNYNNLPEGYTLVYKVEGAGTVQVYGNAFTMPASNVTVSATLIPTSGTCGDYGNEDNVSWAVTDTDDDGSYDKLTISGSGAMKNYGSSNQPWAAFKDDITTANIGDGVTRIGGNAFYQFTALTSVTIASSVTTIGNAAFFECTNLTTVSGASGVTYVDSSAFNETAWKNALPDVLTCVGHVAYLFKGDDTSVNLDAATTQIYEYCFQYSKITSIVIPASVECIGDYAFAHSALEKIYVLRNESTYPKITQLGSSAFEGCNLSAIVVPTAAYSTYSGHWYSYNSKLQRGYNITCNEGITATTTNNGPLVEQGEEVTLIAPTDYTIISASYNDGSEDHEITPVNDVWSFTMPDHDVTVSAVLNGPDQPFVVTTWDDLMAKMAEGGYIRLDADVTDPYKTIDSRLEVPTGKIVTLDLNGHTIDRGLTEKINSGNVISVRGALTLNDSSNPSTGIITGGNSSWGGAVYVPSSGTFTMNGGTISGNTSKSSGGAVYVPSSGTFTMNGGTISGNTSNQGGGGVFIINEGSMFTMNGGTISGNTCGTNSHGGGVYIYDGTIHVSGNAVITGNTNAAGKEENVYLQSDQYIIIDAPLTSGASIGVTSTDAPPTGGDPVEIATGATDGDSQYFHSDINGLTIEAGQNEQAGKLLLAAPASTPWSELKAQLEAGNDVTLTDNVTVLDCDNNEYASITNTVTLDLNGHTVAGKESMESVFRIGNNGNFTLTDSGTGGTITANGGYGVRVRDNNSTFTMTGGTITGSTGGVEVYKGTFNISGNPVITGNTKDGKACNVYLPEGKVITVTGALNADARIGVTTKQEPSDNETVTITSGLSGKGTRANFLSDNDAYGVMPTASGELALVKVVAKSGAVEIWEDEEGKHAIIDGNYSGTEAVELSEDVAVEDVTFNRTFPINKDCTIVLPFNVMTYQLTGVDYVLSFEGIAKDNNKWECAMSIVWEESDEPVELQAYTPYLVRTNSSNIGITGGVTFVATRAAFVERGDWEFRGTAAYTVWDATHNNTDLGKVYGFAATAVSEDKIEIGDFVRATAGAYIYPFRAYLYYKGSDSNWDKSSQAPRHALAVDELPDRIPVRIIDNDATNILTTDFTDYTDSNEWYTLDGRQLDKMPTQKGVYIRGNRKVVIK